MFRRILEKKGPMVGGFFSILQSEPVDFEKYKEARGLYIENDWERVKSIFSKDDYGNWHPAITSTVQMTQFGLFVGAVFGGWLQSAKQTQEFIRNNDASLFFSRKEAHQKLAYQSILGFGKGAVRWAPRYGIFLGGYSLLSSCCEAYRNKTGIIENTIGGGGIGALCRFNYGIKGMISGGIIGAVLGTIYGIILCIILKITKKDMLEIKYAQYAFMKYRQDAIAKKRQPFQDPVDTPDGSHHVDHVLNPLGSAAEIK